MKTSLIMLTFFILGIVAGLLSLLPEFLSASDLSLYALYVLLFLIGIIVGADPKTWSMLRTANVKIVLIPVATIIGTLLSVSAISFLISGLSLRECLAIGSGLGYYSLSSVMITQMSGEMLGVLALLSNIIREIITLLATPALASRFGKIAPIASGGATTMDTTLPIMTKFLGKEYAMIAVFSGGVITVAVPFLIMLILKA